VKSELEVKSQASVRVERDDTPFAMTMSLPQLAWRHTTSVKTIRLQSFGSTKSWVRISAVASGDLRVGDCCWVF